MALCERKELEHLYLYEMRSASDIAASLGCSEGKINYWLRKYGIPKRSVSEAAYAKKNSGHDPFRFSHPASFEEMFLFGLGLGLLWSDKVSLSYTVRFRATDPRRIRIVLSFLSRIYSVDRDRIRFTLSVPEGGSVHRALGYWARALSIAPQRIALSRRRSTVSVNGARRHHGTLEILVHNKKLCELLQAKLADLG